MLHKKLQFGIVTVAVGNLLSYKKKIDKENILPNRFSFLIVAAFLINLIAVNANPPTFQTAVNISIAVIDNVINFTANITEDTELSTANITYNMSGSLTKINFTGLSGTSAQVSNKTIVETGVNSVINFTVYATDTANNVAQSSTLVRVGGNLHNDNFETGDTSRWDSVIIEAGNTVQIDKGIAAYEGTYGLNATTGGTTDDAFLHTAIRHTNKSFIRAMMYLHNESIGQHQTPVAAKTASVSGYIGLWGIRKSSASAPFLLFGWNGTTWLTADNYELVTGRWYCIELFVNVSGPTAGTGNLTVWVDGINRSTDGSINTSDVSIQTTQVGGDGANQDSYMFFDDFIMDDSTQIGCPPEVLPTVNLSVNRSFNLLAQGDTINITVNATDDRGITSAQIISNDTGEKRYYNFTSFNGTRVTFWQNITLSCGKGCVVNISARANDTVNAFDLNDTILTLLDTALPIVNASFNKSTSSIFQNTVINATFNMTDDSNSINGTIIINNTGVKRFFNFSFIDYVNGNTQQMSQNFTISEAPGTVINITAISIDNISNRQQNDTVFTVSSCSYTSGVWNINCADNCVISSPVDLGNNNVAISGSGSLIIKSKIENFNGISIRGTSASNKCEIRCEGACFEIN